MQMMKNINSSKYLLLFISGIFLLVLSPSLLSEGMFLDGTIYATLSRNLATGTGTFWRPHFTDTLFPVFVEHPPLAMGLEGLFFRIFGDSIYVERFYSLATILATGSLIVLIWKQYFKNYRTAWLPLLFWVSMESVSWSAVSNMLENTLAVFICFSVLFYLKSLRSSRFVFLLLSGLMLSLGFLTKGFVTFTPLALPFFIWLIFRERKFFEMVSDTALIILFALLPLLLLYLFTGAKEFLPLYISFAVNKISDGVTIDSRFYILSRLFMELLPSVILLVPAFLITRYRKSESAGSEVKIRPAILFLLMGLAGVLPILATMDQSRYFLLLSLPFFAIFFAMLAEPAAETLVEHLDKKPKLSAIVKYSALLLLAAGLVMSIFYSGTYNRDEIKLKDMKVISALPGRDSTINILPEMYEDWSLHAYYARYYNISLDQDLNNKHGYLLVNRTFSPDTLLNRYERIELETVEFDLYRLRN